MPSAPSHRDHRDHSRLQRLGPIVVLVASLCTLVVLAAAVRAALADRPFAFYTSDPATSTGSSPLLGLLSNLGVLVVWGNPLRRCSRAPSSVALAGGVRRYP